MTKSYCNPITPLDQGETTTNPIYEEGIHINDSKFPFLNAALARLEKIQVIADSISSQLNSRTDFSEHGAWGAHAILEESCNELRVICNKCLLEREVTHGR